MQTYEQWIEAVDSFLSDRLGLTHLDLPDHDYVDWFEAGTTPKEAAQQVVIDLVEEYEMDTGLMAGVF